MLPNNGFPPQIEHVVVLMLENRSLDNACGWLYEHDTPSRVIGKDVGVPYDGLKEGKYWNWHKGTKYVISKAPAGTLNAPSKNPREHYAPTNNQLYGDENHTHLETPQDGKAAGMKGFVQDYSKIWFAPLQEMAWAYTPEALPVLNGLARQYAISDRWFASVPTQTNPNRAFFHCGTSLGREDNAFAAYETFESKTLWNALNPKVESTIYYHDIWSWTSKKCYTHHTFPFLNSVVNPSGRKLFAPFTEFYSDAQAGHLPGFTFLEPAWTHVKNGNDYHPPVSLGASEALVKKVYDSLTSNPAAWKKTLLVVTFDEHGGCFDHVPPPWGYDKIRPDDSVGKSGFKFNRYGVRVPTILVSPWIPQGTVFRSSGPLEYDHTSLTAMILKIFGFEPKKAGLGQRVTAAPTFEDVFTDAPREDVPQVQAPAVEEPSPEDVAREQRFSMVPPPVGKVIAELARDEEETLRMVTEWEQTGKIPQPAAIV